MEPQKSLELIEAMYRESKKTLHRNSFYFVWWGIILVIAGLGQYFMHGRENHWIVWPIVTTIGGIVSGIYGYREGKKSRTLTSGDRMVMFIWLGFMFTLVFAITFSVYHHLSPMPLVLLFSAYATFLTGCVSHFRPLIFGGIILFIGAGLGAWTIDIKYHGILFAVSILAGYVVPGFMLSKKENA